MCFDVFRVRSALRYNGAVNTYFALWAAAFIALVIAVVLTALIYKSMTDGLDLNGWLQEGITALAVSAGQAGGFVLQQHFPIPSSYHFRIYGRFSVAATVFVLCLWFGYKLTHLTTWDSLEYAILLLVDGVLVSITLFALT